MSTRYTTGNSAIDWLIRKADATPNRDGASTDYHFHGSVSWNMIQGVTDWFKAQGEMGHDGGHTKSYCVALDELVVDGRYTAVVIKFKRRISKSDTTIDLWLELWDCPAE